MNRALKLWNIEKSQRKLWMKRWITLRKQLRPMIFRQMGLWHCMMILLTENLLGTTAKFPRNAMAFKWADEMRDTRLLEIEWSPSRTGLINPVAIFEPVELEGTTVSRASVHNISIMKELKLGIGDTIRVYKANMIIPQIAENLTGSGNAPIPHTCPACGQETVVKKENDVECLFLRQSGVPGQEDQILWAFFTSRDAMNIDGLSEATLEKFIAVDLSMILAIFLRSADTKMRSWRWKALDRNPMIILWKALNGRKRLRFQG